MAHNPPQAATAAESPNPAAGFLSFHSSGDSRFYLRSLALIVLAVWVLAKSFLFQGLEYTSDLFSFLQMTRISLERGILFENDWGRVAAIHNYYTVLWFSPLTYFFDAYGLFLGTALLYFFALWRLTALPDSLLSTQNKLALIVLLLGPIGFWLFDNPIYGWHLELNFVPLALLLAISLLERRRWRSAILSLLFVLTREDGAVLACLIFLTYEIFIKEGGNNKTGPEKIRAALKIAAPWAVVFLAGIAVLHLQKTYFALQGQIDYSDRLADAAARLSQALAGGEGAYLLWRMYAASLLLILSAWVLLPPRVLPKLAGAFLLLSLPLYLVVAVASSAYAGAYHGFLWPPRFSLLWGLAASSAVLFLSADARPEKITWIRLGAYLILAGASIFLQIQGLNYYRGYSYGDRIFSLFKAGPNLIGSRLTASERGFVECVAGRIKKMSPVLTEGSLFALFQRHDIVFPARIQNAWSYPILAVCDLQKRMPFHDPCLDFVAAKISDPKWRTIQKGAIVAAASEPAAQTALQACAAEESPRTDSDAAYFFSGRRDSGKYLEGDQTLTVRLRQPRMRSSRMMRM